MSRHDAEVTMGETFLESIIVRAHGDRIDSASRSAILADLATISKVSADEC